ncbi:MAG: TetR/AcrR family transcriptional regulator [Myxococcota bacterium]
MSLDARQRILDHAIRLFAHQGYGSTSVREVAEAAGITKPTLYYHFGSKEGLFRAIVDDRMDGLLALVRATVDGPGPVVERITTFVDTYLRGAVQDQHTMRFMLTCGLPEAPGDPDHSVLGRHMRSIAPLTELIRQGVERAELCAELDPRIAVMALIGAANLHLVVALEGEPLPDDIASRIVRTWLYGVAPP